MKSLKCMRRLLAVFLGLSTILFASSSHGAVEKAGVYGDWGVWSGWFWPFNNTEPPNLYGPDEALARYDAFAGANSATWEHNHHGPALNQPDWAGHCHAWAAASVWEAMPTTTRVCGGVTFRPRDQAALLTEAYYNDTQSTEFSEYRPSPGLLWRYLRQELMGQNSMHGHAMAIIGNLSQYRGQVWNYPIFQYQVDYTQDASGETYSGTITLWFADDGSSGYADSLGLSPVTITYRFSALNLDANQEPLDSGNWAGGDPSQYPTSIWRPYAANCWTNYLANPELSPALLSQVLDAVPNQCFSTVVVSQFPQGGGLASTGGVVNCGSHVTVHAAPNPGYSFANWTEGETVVSSSSSYTFAVSNNRNLVANFVPGTPQLTISNVGGQAVISWDASWQNYQLESCNSMAPSQVWIPVSSQASLVGGNFAVVDPQAAPCKFYRLRHL